jgi:hypothetical protein
MKNLSGSDKGRDSGDTGKSRESSGHHNLGGLVRFVVMCAMTLAVAIGATSVAAGAATPRATARAAARAAAQSAAQAAGTAARHARSVEPVGSYTGRNPQNGGAIDFYVSSDQKSLQEVSIPSVYLACTPGGGMTADHLGIASVPLKANGSFSTTTTQQGVFSAFPATFTYSFQGNYDGVNASGVPTVTGRFSETIKYTSSTANVCTSNIQSWTATRDAQPAQPASAPPVGSYTGVNPQNGGAIDFYVSSDQKSLQDVSIPSVYLACTPGGGMTADHLGIASVPLAANGSFSATTSQQGVFESVPATFAYTFQGNVHGVSPTGAARVAGMFQETVIFTNSKVNVCTSDDQSWTATRDVQPIQPSSAPPAGSYTGVNPQNGGAIEFYVPSNRKSLQDVSIPSVYLACTPGGGMTADHLDIASVPLAANGSFSATTTQQGVFEGVPATFTYTFQGNFHGVNPSGAARAAGMFRESVTFTNSKANDCTSNDQSWTASLS